MNHILFLTLQYALHFPPKASIINFIDAESCIDFCSYHYVTPLTGYSNHIIVSLSLMARKPLTYHYCVYASLPPSLLSLTLSCAEG